MGATGRPRGGELQRCGAAQGGEDRLVDEGHVGVVKEETGTIYRKRFDAGEDRSHPSLFPVRIVDEDDIVETSQRRLDVLAPEPGDDDERPAMSESDSGCSPNDGLAVQRQQQLGPPHPRASARGEEDAGENGGRLNLSWRGSLRERGGRDPPRKRVGRLRRRRFGRFQSEALRAG